jgi:hypothetical protein
LHKSNRHNRFLELRKAYPYFVYQSYSVFRTKTSLRAEFLFDLSGRYTFRPVLEIPFRDFYDLEKVPARVLEHFVFHIGLIELVSYWKAACPPEVRIKAGYLNEDQIRWWRKLYFHGLGEFFYLNGIDTTPEDFMTIVSDGKKFPVSSLTLSDRKTLVPVGGGKDSVVTLELLKNSAFSVKPFLLNPREAVRRTIEIAGFALEDSAVVYRKLDPKLLELNAAGFLNGHTPFSALLAFVSSLTALLSGSRYIALSNESSANQSTVPGSKVNHQYSKSFEFENDFNRYLRQYLHPDLLYFSFLRPLNELQIAALFSTFPQHHFSFRSCNAGSKTDSWCGVCPKCLFTYTILSPFLSQEKLEKIFGKNLLKDKELVEIMDELDGAVAVKPFECVGTPDEVSAAVMRSVEKGQVSPSDALVKRMRETVGVVSSRRFRELLTAFNDEHFLTDDFLNILQKALAHVTV